MAKQYHSFGFLCAYFQCTGGCLEAIVRKAGIAPTLINEVPHLTLAQRKIVAREVEKRAAKLIQGKRYKKPATVAKGGAVVPTGKASS